MSDWFEKLKERVESRVDLTKRINILLVGFYENILSETDKLIKRANEEIYNNNSLELVQVSKFHWEVANEESGNTSSINISQDKLAIVIDSPNYDDFTYQMNIDAEGHIYTEYNGNIFNPEDLARKLVEPIIEADYRLE